MGLIRNMNRILLLFFQLLFPLQLLGQFFPAIEFVPSGRLFPPLLANTFEGRVGTILRADGKLRLDIGNSIDVVAIALDSTRTQRLTIGVDFFTYTALRAEENFHFPVEASDYFFGVNFNYASDLAVGQFLARLRVSHISAHLVDGSYDAGEAAWRYGGPRVYSREFVDLVAAIKRTYYRFYTGVQYLFHDDPPEIPNWSYQAGMELFLENTLGRSLHPYLAYDFRLVPVRVYSGVHSVQGGIKIGRWRGPGLNLFVAYFSGHSIHGEFYDIRETYWASGFTVDF